MNELDNLLRRIEALLQHETDPVKRMQLREVIKQTIRRFEQLKSA